MKLERIKAALAGLLAAGIVLSTGVTGAYLTYKTLPKQNNVTVGKITTTLTEPGWDSLTPQDKVLWPGKTVTKDPTVTSTAESTGGCYVYLKVTIPRALVRTYSDTTKQFENGGSASRIDLFTYTVNSAWTEMPAYASTTDAASVHVYAYTSKLAPNSSTPPLFTSVKYANVIEGDIGKGTLLDINVEMTSVQCDFFPSATTPQEVYDAYQKGL